MRLPGTLIYGLSWLIYEEVVCVTSPVQARRLTALPTDPSRLPTFIGWASNHFNNLHIEHSLEKENTLEMGIGN